MGGKTQGKMAKHTASAEFLTGGVVRNPKKLLAFCDDSAIGA
jgi:hypothetical protein